MSEMKEFVKQRGNIRARLTMFEKYITPLMTCKETSTVKINELRLRLSKSRELSCSFDEVQSQIEVLDEDTAAQMLEREITEDKFFHLIAQGESMLEYFESTNKAESSAASCKGFNNIKLPPLKILPFSGDSNKWLSFRDTYLSLIHNNESIDNVSKFHYLKSYLDGAASSVISSVTVSSSNYSIAWSLLCERYDNKRLLINEHIKCLFSIEALQRETEDGIRNLIDGISKNLSALNSLGEPTDTWDTLIIYMASTKLDSVTARNWEEHRSSKDSPTLNEFYSFLSQRATVLETMNAGRTNKFEKRHSLPKTKSFITSSVNVSPHQQCAICKQTHKIYECHKFKSLPVEERISQVSSLKLCSNCFRGGHHSYQCRLGGCRICHRKHNTLLHKQQSIQSNIQTEQSTLNNNTTMHASDSTNLPSHIDDSAAPGPSSTITLSAVSTNQALLSTALVKVTNNDKEFILRALLDCGSQSSFISLGAQIKIGSSKTKANYQCVSGLGNITLNITEHCNINIQSLHGKFKMPVKCFILPQITDCLPQATVRFEDLGIPNFINLADPNFYQPSEIDLLLGADIFWELLGTARINLGPQRPILQETYLGWIVAGPMGGSYSNNNNIKSKIHCNFSKEISTQLTKFWELEEIPDNTETHTDNYCEKLFNNTTHRDDDGRFCVQIPLKESIDMLGDSYNIAKKRFMHLERKLSRNPVLRQEYGEFIHEYDRLGHMTEISKPVFGCYLPHHAVLKETSETTKLRVVFDASAKTASGMSFNDIQHIGPVVQDDLFSILLRFRQHQYAVSADVEKMYRQILVDPNQRKLQLILWRDEPSQPIKIFQLNTVTYGTASAPFLSTRCLLQVSQLCNDAKISQTIKDDFYVDDFLSGAESEGDLHYMINSVAATLSSACFNLRKWRTNAPQVFENESNTMLSNPLDLSTQSSVLGLNWDPALDVLRFPVDIQCDQNVTKRTVLSNSAKLFDPLGLLSPCTIIPKIILQKLWLTKLDWDDSIESALKGEWLTFVYNLNAVSRIEIPRRVLINKPVTIDLHSFSDASQVAYAAAIFLRSIDNSGHVLVRLLCAKTKVAPVKPTTIPRLELCGALLSARLSMKVIKALRLKIDSVVHWTDSTIVLSWLSSKPCDLKQFVSNRVGEIQDLTASDTWRHVPGDKNPADIASRGLNPRSMQSASLWWEGPTFLREDPSNWPQGFNKEVKELPEFKSNNLTTHSLHSTSFTPSSVIKFERYSKFTTLQRVIAYIIRFIHNLRNKHARVTGPLTTGELNCALVILIKQHQTECFLNELKILQSEHDLSPKSRMLSLSPFIDEDGILCVGGRLQNSGESYGRIHPILLEAYHPFTKLLFSHYHKKLLHCGPQLLLSDIRNKFWPIRGRLLARSTINNCKTCRILKAKGVNPIMGNLPASRVTPSLPFQISGVDFAGPFYITDRKGRGCKITKCYLCLFICFATRALHLEVASDLTSDVFILCLRRFISRRGKPLQLYCDNGTNFVGANNEITRFLNQNNEEVSDFAANEGIQFKFSPAYSPHFGGLWEAGVKSAKYHLTRILGDKHFTFEELSTLFAQIEAILNSRPLTPLSSDPNDLNPLTPAHFLIGRPLTALPSENLLDEKPDRLHRYKRLERIRQDFWNRWRKEYLSELQQKVKWRVTQRGLLKGDLVVIKDANMPPLKWRMGRILNLFPGSDGTTRVADVYTTRGVVRRAVHNLCSLPDASATVSTSTAVPRESEDLDGGEDVKSQH